ncbi:MAG TPA: CRTAC1 family protein [Acidobacteriota bacterium]|nr:CRTAC1 family protein [Acidobacteriota bacterium]
MSRRKRLLLSVVVILLASFAALTLTDRRGRAFLADGRAIISSLQVFQDALRSRDGQALARRFSPDFSGTVPDAWGRSPATDSPLTMQELPPPPRVVDRPQAVQSWLSYLSALQVEDIRINLHRIEERSALWTATVRIAVSGTVLSDGSRLQDTMMWRLRFRPRADSAAASSGVVEAAGGRPDHRGTGHASSQRAGPVVTSAEWVEGVRTRSPALLFSDVAAASGTDFRHRIYPPFLEAGLAFPMIRYGPGGITAADYDKDGHIDLLFPDGVHLRLMRNLGDGTFQDVTESAGLSGLDGVSVALFADLDNDGRRDLFVSRTFSPNQVFRNLGDGTFQDLTADSGLGQDCCTTAASMADIDGDGDLDVYVGRYIDPRRDIPTFLYARNGEANRLYRNEGRFRFTDITGEAGVGDKGLCLGTVFGDYDDDGDPDLYVVNDFGRNTLYRNLGGGRFADVTTESGALAYGAGMNATLADYDNDQHLDLYVTNIRSDFAWMAEAPTVWAHFVNRLRTGYLFGELPIYWEIASQSGLDPLPVFQQMSWGNTLLRNRGNGTFEDVTWRARANPPGWFWGNAAGDLDNDGDLDFYAANGWIYGRPGTEIELDFLADSIYRPERFKSGALFDPDRFQGRSWHGYQRNRLLWNQGDGTFREVGYASGAGLLLNSRGVAAADFLNRGRLDLAVAACDDRHALLRNRYPAGRWIQVQLEGRRSNRDAVGARIVLRAGGQIQMREVVLGDGYGSQNPLRQHFGIGSAERIDRLTVLWPASGLRQQFSGLAANQLVHVVEGKGGELDTDTAKGKGDRP